MIRTISFDESLLLLHDLYHKPRVPALEAGLRRVEFLLKELGNPHRNFRSVHVTGSCGKGSTTTMVGSILQAAGFRTGYFRSPHLTSYTERIVVDGKEISEQEWCDCFNQIWPVVDKMQSSGSSDYALGRPTLFEVLFTLMALYFSEIGVEWGAIETGLGGRLDATNTLKADVAVVTNVSLEHTKVLGNDVEAISKEKAAIIKEGSHAVTAAEDPVALGVIENRASSVGSPLWKVGREVKIRVGSESLYGQTIFLMKGSNPIRIELPIAGSFQATNAATAFATVEALRTRGVEIADDAIVRGLQSVHMPGRFEVIRDEPLVILDGAHSPAGAYALKSTMEGLRLKDVVMIFAAQEDKDVMTMAKHLAPLTSQVILTKVQQSERSAEPSTLTSAFEALVDTVIVEDDVDRALKRAQVMSRSISPVVVTGSLYLVGYCRERLMNTLGRPGALISGHVG